MLGLHQYLISLLGVIVVIVLPSIGTIQSLIGSIIINIDTFIDQGNHRYIIAMAPDSL